MSKTVKRYILIDKDGNYVFMIKAATSEYMVSEDEEDALRFHTFEAAQKRQEHLNFEVDIKEITITALKTK